MAGQARSRRQIDELKKKGARYEELRDALPEDHAKRAWFNQKLANFRREIDRCWRKYEQRNRALAHLASNVLLLLCQVHGCSLLSMRSLKTLKTTGRGRGVRRQMAQLSQQLDHTRRNLATPAVQMSSDRPAVPHRTTPWAAVAPCPHCGAPAET